MDSPSTTLGLSTFYWIIIGAALVATILFTIIFCVCGYKFFSTGKDQTLSGAPAEGQTFIQNNTNLGFSIPRPWSSDSIEKKCKTKNEISLEEFPGFSGKKEINCEELDGMMTLDEQRALSVAKRV